MLSRQPSLFIVPEDFSYQHVQINPDLDPNNCFAQIKQILRLDIYYYVIEK